MAVKQGQVLEMLDASVSPAWGTRTSFPSLESLGRYIIACRLSAYSDGMNWVLAFDITYYDERAARVELRMSAFGPAALADVSTVSDCVIELVPLDPTFTEGDQTLLCLRPDANFIYVRDQMVAIETGIPSYENAGITLFRPPEIEPHDVCRLLKKRIPTIFDATDAELRKCLVADLPLVVRLSDWQHPLILDGELPSNSPSFRSIAKLLERKSSLEYQEVGCPNTDWRNWPQQGTL